MPKVEVDFVDTATWTQVIELPEGASLDDLSHSVEAVITDPPVVWLTTSDQDVTRKIEMRDWRVAKERVVNSFDDLTDSEKESGWYTASGKWLGAHEFGGDILSHAHMAVKARDSFGWNVYSTFNHSPIECYPGDTADHVAERWALKRCIQQLQQPPHEPRFKGV